MSIINQFTYNTNIYKYLNKYTIVTFFPTRKRSYMKIEYQKWISSNNISSRSKKRYGEKKVKLESVFTLIFRTINYLIAWKKFTIGNQSWWKFSQERRKKELFSSYIRKALSLITINFLWIVTHECKKLYNLVTLSLLCVHDVLSCWIEKEWLMND